MDSKMVPYRIRGRCRRCDGVMFPDEDGDYVCLMCGERTYDWLSVYTDRLLDAMEQQELRDELRARIRRRVVSPALMALRWDAVAGRRS